MGIINANLDSGLQEEPFLPTREIHETYVRHSNTPHFHKIQNEPLAFNIVCAFNDGMNEDKLRAVRRWLGSANDFRELYFSNAPHRKYFVMYEGITTLSHTGLDGYFEIVFRANSPYACSDLIETEIFDEFPAVIANNSDIPIYPEVLIKKDGDGNIEITNQTTGQVISLSNLQDTETIYINGDKKTFKSSMRNNFRTNQFLCFAKGNNIIEVDGDCQIKFRYREKYLPHGGIEDDQG